MKAIDAIRTALQVSDDGMMRLVEDMRDSAMTQPTPRGGNHVLWVLGHITFIEGNLSRVILGESNPVDHWAPLFAPGSEPTSDPTAYPPFDEVLSSYKKLRARNLKLLEEIGEAGLDRPTKSPPRGMEQILSTTGRTFLIIALHQMNHRGQLADCRRAAGRQPMFTPGP
jgi:uncharacterized damage-inducible protein DinB